MLTMDGRRQNWKGDWQTDGQVGMGLAAQLDGKKRKVVPLTEMGTTLRETSLGQSKIQDQPRFKEGQVYSTSR